MNITESLIVHLKDKRQLDAVEAALKALDVEFERAPEGNYDPGFVSQIKESQEQAKAGKVVSYTQQQLDNLCK